MYHIYYMNFYYFFSLWANKKFQIVKLVDNIYTGFPNIKHIPYKYIIFKAIVYEQFLFFEIGSYFSKLVLIFRK